VSRAVEDGYAHELVPGLRASADGARLARELGFSADRLEELSADPPGLYAEVALADDREEAIWLALLIAWLGPPTGEKPFAAIEAVRVPWSTGEVPDEGAETAAAYRAWAARAGSQEAGLAGDPSWTPERRFERAFERLSVKGLRRAPRYEMLVSLGRLGVVDLRPTSLHLVEPLDSAMVAAKRVFGIGDAMNIRRRSAVLAEAAEVPIEALDLALVNWSRPEEERITAGARVTGDEHAARIAALLGVEPR